MWSMYILLFILSSTPINLSINLSISMYILCISIYLSELSDGQPFVLSAGFPPKDIQDASSSLSAAGLTGASIILKTL